ncbi:hypothetical protein R1sor_005999 [Riccia sorocarpa]|uniref:Uncharacterized protein n=1 Tax=Riccia sorocarpa TaxID=122646 RepID=A0ABD3HLP9_9MARC
MSRCDSGAGFICRDKDEAIRLKVGAIGAILLAGALGVALPLLGKNSKYLRTDGNFFFVAKAFAAGVILATGFVHMLPDAEENLTSPCLPEHPWHKLPWFGFGAMISALVTLLIDFVGTEYYERKHGVAVHDRHSNSTHILHERLESSQDESSVSHKPDGHGMHIVGMRAHAASHGHSHESGHHGEVINHNSIHHGHSHFSEAGHCEKEVSIRHIVISQVLELGIVAHSVIIGVSLGVSNSPCTIRPLFGALCFHQFFEGFALGGCISQAGFKNTSVILMACFFTFTTPFGIGLGIGIASSYNENGQVALIVEGTFDSISAGILIYMSLVDLIAADFLSKRMKCDRKLQIFSYLSLFSGAAAMSALAIWA